MLPAAVPFCAGHAVAQHPTPGPLLSTRSAFAYLPLLTQNTTCSTTYHLFVFALLLLCPPSSPCNTPFPPPCPPQVTTKWVACVDLGSLQAFVGRAQQEAPRDAMQVG